MSEEPISKLPAILADAMEDIGWTPEPPRSSHMASYVLRAQQQSSIEDAWRTMVCALYDVCELERTPDAIDIASGLPFKAIARGARVIARDALTLIGACDVNLPPRSFDENRIPGVLDTDDFVTDILSDAMAAQLGRGQPGGSQAQDRLAGDRANRALHPLLPRRN